MKTYIYLSDAGEIYIVDAMSRNVAEAKAKGQSRNARLTLLLQAGK